MRGVAGLTNDKRTDANVHVDVHVHVNVVGRSHERLT